MKKTLRILGISMVMRYIMVVCYLFGFALFVAEKTWIAVFFIALSLISMLAMGVTELWFVQRAIRGRYK